MVNLIYLPVLSRESFKLKILLKITKKLVFLQKIRMNVFQEMCTGIFQRLSNADYQDIHRFWSLRINAKQLTKK